MKRENYTGWNAGQQEQAYLPNANRTRSSRHDLFASQIPPEAHQQTGWPADWDPATYRSAVANQPATYSSQFVTSKDGGFPRVYPSTGSSGRGWSGARVVGGYSTGGNHEVSSRYSGGSTDIEPQPPSYGMERNSLLAQPANIEHSAARVS